MKHAIIATLALALTASVMGVDRRPLNQFDVDLLTDETQVIAPCGDDHFNLIWWIPIEFWQATFANDDSMSEADKKGILSTLDRYVLVGVCQSDISDFGAFSFYGKDEVTSSMRMGYEDASGKVRKLAPLDDDEIDPDLEILLNVFQPILGAAMGNMGENFHFYVLADRDASGKRLVDPYTDGRMRFRLGTRNSGTLETQIQFPLNALYVPRKCPNGQDAHVSWTYCPWTGEQLAD